MGFLSFSSKNKQESTDDGNYVARDDENALVRSKRASTAGQPADRRTRDRKGDPVLPEKKRARRRLVGAVALALAVAIGLPMILDSEPRPLATNIDIQIPSKEKAPPQPLPRAVADADALGADEEIVEEGADASPAPAEVATLPAPVLKAEPKPEPKPKAEPKPPLAKTEPKAEPKPAVKPAEKPAPKVTDKPVVKPKPVEEKNPVEDKKPVEEKKPVEAKKPVVKTDPPKEADRAMAILEGKAADKPAPAEQKFVVQVAALASQDKVDELQSKLRAAGISSFTRRANTEAGERIRVQIGPFSKEEAEQVRSKLKGIGLSGMMVAN